jgi:hypothetical protein
MNDFQHDEVLRFKRGRRRSPKTATEIIQELESNLEWVAKRDEYMRQHRERIQENLLAGAPLVRQLRQAGLDVQTVSDLFNKRLDYRHVIPLLLRWLPRMQNPAVKEAIVRALTDKWARPLGAPALIGEFRRTDHAVDRSHYRLKWAIGNALSVVADDSVFHDIVDLLKDRNHGVGREQLPEALLHMKLSEHRAEAEEILLKVASERPRKGDYTYVRAAIALGKMKSRRAKPLIKLLLKHEQEWVRKEAVKALERIEKAEQKARDKNPRTKKP